MLCYYKLSSALSQPISSPIWLLPLVLDLCHHFLVPQFPFSADDTRTYWTAALLLTGAGVNRSFPDMTCCANPPSLFMGTGSDHLGCERIIERGMPLSRNLRLTGCQIIEPWQHFFSGTIWAAGVFCCSAFHGSYIIMAERTSPPDMKFAKWGYHGG